MTGQPMHDLLAPVRKYLLTTYTVIGVVLAVTWTASVVLYLRIAQAKTANFGTILLIVWFFLTWYLLVFGITVAVVSIQHTINVRCTELAKIFTGMQEEE